MLPILMVKIEMSSGRQAGAWFQFLLSWLLHLASYFVVEC